MSLKTKIKSKIRLKRCDSKKLVEEKKMLLWISVQGEEEHVLFLLCLPSVVMEAVDKRGFLYI